MAEKHTPTPWRLFKTPNGERVVGIGELTGEGIAALWRDDPEALANAALIVKAVNNHDRLVKALEALGHQLLPDALCKEKGGLTKASRERAMIIVRSAIAAVKEG